jgi:predicted GNAT superfamily acetyltransferase
MTADELPPIAQDESARVSIRPLKAWEEYLAAERLQREVWQMPDWRDVVPANLMVTVNKNAGLTLGAFSSDGRLVGLAFGFGAMEELGGQKKLKHCSHMLAVLPEYRSQQIGKRLKFWQRDFTLAQGIELMTWTYDPLQARNANLNLVHLGAVARRYMENAYGEMTDGLNAGIASDRFQVEWWLNSPRVQACVAGQPLRFDWDELTRGGARPVFQVGLDAGGLPRVERENELSSTTLLLEIPANIGAVKTASLDLAREWRACTRKVFQRAFADGYAAVGFVYTRREGPPRAAYVLSRELPKLQEG